MSDRVLRGLDPNVLPLRVSESNFKSDISGSPFGQENTRTSSIVKKEEAVTNLRQWLVQEELVMNANDVENVPACKTSMDSSLHTLSGSTDRVKRSPELPVRKSVARHADDASVIHDLQGQMVSMREEIARYDGIHDHLDLQQQEQADRHSMLKLELTQQLAILQSRVGMLERNQSEPISHCPRRKEAVNINTLLDVISAQGAATVQIRDDARHRPHSPSGVTPGVTAEPEMERGGAVRHEPPPPAACFQEQLAGHGLEIGDLRRGLARAEEELARVDVLRDVVDINSRAMDLLCEDWDKLRRDVAHHHPPRPAAPQELERAPPAAPADQPPVEQLERRIQLVQTALEELECKVSEQQATVAELSCNQHKRNEESDKIVSAIQEQMSRMEWQRSELANEIGELNTQVKDVGGCSAEVKACSTGVVGEAPRGELVDRMNSLQHTVDALEQKLAACTALVCGLTNNDWEHTTDLEKRIVKLEACVTSLKSEKVQQWKGKALAQAAVMLLASSISAFLGSRRSIRSHGLNIGEARVPQRQATGAGGREMVPVHQEISNTPSITSETLSVGGAMN